MLIAYVCIIDSINFCFWPLDKFEYEQLIGVWNNKLNNDIEVFSPERLSKMTEEELREIYSDLEDLPLADERARLIRELGQVVLDSFDGKFETLLAAAGGSAAKLVDILVSKITGFRDEATFNGRQCFFYKRA